MEEWEGRIWMNPPYSVDLIGKFCEKLVLHFSKREIVEAIVLVNNATETAWFNELTQVASAVVFPRGRVHFISSTGNSGTPLQGQALIYIGRNHQKFLSEFKPFGWGATLW